MVEDSRGEVDDVGVAEAIELRLPLASELGSRVVGGAVASTSQSEEPCTRRMEK